MAPSIVPWLSKQWRELHGIVSAYINYVCLPFEALDADCECVQQTWKRHIGLYASGFSNYRITNRKSGPYFRSTTSLGGRVLRDPSAEAGHLYASLSRNISHDLVCFSHTCWPVPLSDTTTTADLAYAYTWFVETSPVKPAILAMTRSVPASCSHTPCIW